MSPAVSNSVPSKSNSTVSMAAMVFA